MSIEEHLTGEGMQTVAGWLAVIGTGCAGLLAGYHKLMRHIGVEKEGAAISAGGRAVVELMHKELNRLAKQNEQLAKRLNEMQLEMVGLQQINLELTATVERLRAELSRLGWSED